jgi:hypothetical protein
MELECIDRMYLNTYVPQLTTEAGVASFERDLETERSDRHRARSRLYRVLHSF